MREGGRYIVKKGGKPKLVERTATPEPGVRVPPKDETEAEAPTASGEPTTTKAKE